jgi:hypothetical protein
MGQQRRRLGAGGGKVGDDVVDGVRAEGESARGSTAATPLTWAAWRRPAAGAEHRIVVSSTVGHGVQLRVGA